MHVHIEEQIAKLHACTAISTIRPCMVTECLGRSQIKYLGHVPNKCTHLFDTNLYRVEIICL